MIDLDASSSSSDPPPVRVLKFGGTCLGRETDVETMTRIVHRANQTTHPVVVVSAAPGVTDELVRATAETRADRATADVWTRRVARRYRSLANNLLDQGSVRSQYDAALRIELSELRRALQSLRQSDGEGAAARDVILATGERAMAPLVAGILDQCGTPSTSVDASALVHTDATHGKASVDWATTRRRIRKWARAWSSGTPTPVPIIPGFIGGTDNRRTTTLGRGGSDLSAALFARALDAERMERWTDTEGLYSCDPAEHDTARRLDHLNFEQARIWTRAGRLGMHPSTIDPLAAAGIPLHVRSIHAPDGDTTRIVPKRTLSRC